MSQSQAKLETGYRFFGFSWSGFLFRLSGFSGRSGFFSRLFGLT